MDFDLLEDPRPLRHAIESDSSEGEDSASDLEAERQPKRATKARAEGKVELQGDTSSLRTGGTAIVLVGEAGKLWSKGTELDLGQSEDVKVCVDGAQEASIATSSSVDVVIAVSAGVPLIAQASSAAQILDVLQPARLTVIDSYSYPSYFSSSPDRRAPALGHPLRFLTTDDATRLESIKGLEHYQPPNMISGFSAAIVSESRHRSIPATLILLPTSTPTSLQTNHPTSPSSLHSSISGPSPIQLGPAALGALSSLAQMYSWGQVGWDVAKVKNALSGERRLGGWSWQQKRKGGAKKGQALEREDGLTSMYM